jgi:TatD DNase family protein
MSFKITDTHAHICDPAFDQDLHEVINRARSIGIEYIVCVGENLNDAIKNLELAEKNAIFLPSAGLFPDRLNYEEANEIVSFIRKNREKLFAVGEVGLDYWLIKSESDRDTQRSIFGMFIDLALELDLPLNVHSRSAGRHAIDFLLRRDARKVQLHAFDGKATTAMPAVEAGYYFSIPPSIVRSRQKQRLVKQLPISNILAETDSPVLGPDPGARNEPANVIEVITAVAEIKGITDSEVMENIVENTRRLYGNTESGFDHGLEL